MANRTKLTQRARARFLAALTEVPNVTEAAQRVNISRTRMYELRRDDEAFAAEWDAAIEAAVDHLEAEAWRRAYQHSDRLMEKLLSAHRPEKYRETQRHEHSGPDGSAITLKVEYTE